MPAMNHQDAHELIATLRYAVNESFEKNQKLSNFNPEAHNLCIAHCTFNNAPPLNLFSFSAMSSFSKTALNKLVHEWGVEFVPDVATNIRTFACGGMGQFHTEPRLINYIHGRPGFIGHLTDVTLVSEIDCCGACVPHSINAFKQTFTDVQVHIIELGMKPSLGIGPQYGYAHLY